MKLRRIYFPWKHYNYKVVSYITDYADFVNYCTANNKVELIEKDNADYVMENLTSEEQAQYWKNCVHRIMNNTREVLDGLDSASEFKVSWNNYGKVRCGVGKPPEEVLEMCKHIINPKPKALNIIQED